MSVTLPGTIGRRPTSSRWKLTSSDPTGTGCSIDAGESRRPAASAIHTPPRCSPTSTTPSVPWLRSTISWAMRVSARRTSSALKTSRRPGAMCQAWLLPSTYRPHGTDFTFDANGSFDLNRSFLAALALRPPSFARFARSLLSVELSERPPAAPNCCAPPGSRVGARPARARRASRQIASRPHH